jgi:hypothetical protein
LRADGFGGAVCIIFVDDKSCAVRLISSREAQNVAPLPSLRKSWIIDRHDRERIKMSERVAAHKRKLTDARAYLDHVLDQVEGRWETPVYSEGASWTVRQLVIHLVVTDKGHNNMIRAIAQGENTIPDDFDLERFNRRSVEKRADMTPDELRDSLRATAAERLVWLDTCNDATLEKKGRHGTMQILSIAEILDVVAGHERLHAGDIARILEIQV